MQTPDPSARKPRYTNNAMLLSLILFLAHTISVICMLAKTYDSFDRSGCRAETRPTSAYGAYYVEPLPPNPFPLVTAQGAIDLPAIERRSSDMYVEAFHPTLYPGRWQWCW